MFVFRAVCAVMGATLLGGALLLGTAVAAPVYTVTDLGALGGPFAFSSAAKINASGAVVGQSDAAPGDRRAFYGNGSDPLQNLGTIAPGDPTSLASDINNRGQVVGYDLSAATGQLRAFLWNGSGPLQDLGTLGGDRAYANGINDDGTVVGTSTMVGAGNARGFLWKGGTMTALGTLPLSSFLGDGASSGNAINKAGFVVGDSVTDVTNPGLVVEQHAYYWTGSGALVDMGTLGTGDRSTAFDISDTNFITGFSRVTPGSSAFQHAYRATVGGSLLDLGTLGGDNSYGIAVNNLGAVVGQSDTVANGLQAFFWSGSGPLQNLNDLIEPTSGWTLLSANGINDHGQIVGVGRLGNVSHAYLLNTSVVPESGTLLLIGVAIITGSIGVVFRRARVA